MIGFLDCRRLAAATPAIGSGRLKFFLSGSLDRDAVPGQGGGVVGVRRFYVADFAPEIRVQIAGMLRAAGAFFSPGFVGRWSAGRAAGVGAETGDRMRS